MIELKTGRFKPDWAGKLHFYLSAVDDLLRSGQDGPTVGLLLCKSDCGVHPANIDKAIGASSYRVTRELPDPIREEVPTLEDLQEVVTKLRGEMETLRHERRNEE